MILVRFTNQRTALIHIFHPKYPLDSTLFDEWRCCDRSCELRRTDRAIRIVDGGTIVLRILATMNVIEEVIGRFAATMEYTIAWYLRPLIRKPDDCGMGSQQQPPVARKINGVVYPMFGGGDPNMRLTPVPVSGKLHWRDRRIRNRALAASSRSGLLISTMECADSKFASCESSRIRSGLKCEGVYDTLER
jgi:hypothetical protein